MKPPKIADAIVHEIESLILEGGLKPGQRLPPERELAEHFQVSRPSLREALQQLAARGLVESRRGGGTYVANMMDTAFVNPLLGLLRNHPETLGDLVEMRYALEGVAAYFAALRSTAEDKELLKQRHATLSSIHERGDDPVAEAKADAEFHLGIAEAAHNVVLLHVMGGLFRLLQSGIFTSHAKLFTRAGASDQVRRQHEALFRAVLEGDPEAARGAAHEHLAYIKRALRDIDEENQRIRRSRRRLRGLG